MRQLELAVLLVQLFWGQWVVHHIIRLALPAPLGSSLPLVARDTPNMFDSEMLLHDILLVFPVESVLLDDGEI